MAEKSSTHRGNRFYTLASMQRKREGARRNQPSPFVEMRQSELAIKAAILFAASPNVMAFPVRRTCRSTLKKK